MQAEMFNGRAAMIGFAAILVSVWEVACVAGEGSCLKTPARLLFHLFTGRDVIFEIAR
jgi:hypothetical protein